VSNLFAALTSLLMGSLHIIEVKVEAALPEFDDPNLDITEAQGGVLGKGSRTSSYGDGNRSIVNPRG